MRSRSSANNPHEIIRLTCSMLCAQMQISRITDHSKRMILDSIWQPFAGLKKQGKNQQDNIMLLCSCHALYVFACAPATGRSTACIIS